MSLSESRAHTRSARRERYFALIVLSTSILLSLLAAEFGLRWYQDSINNSSSGDPGLLRYHAQLGWSLTPSWSGRHQHHDFDVNYTINEHGYRGTFPVDLNKKTRSRIGIIGDSFSFGLGVDDQDVFVEKLNILDPDSEYLNLSIPGYSTDQQLLLLKNIHNQIDADTYILVIYLANDILDNLLSYPLQLDQAKPYFDLVDKRLVLKNVPVPTSIKPALLRSKNLNTVVFGDTLNSYRGNAILESSQLWKRIASPKAKLTKSKVNEILETRLVRQKQMMLALISEFVQFCQTQHVGFKIALLPGKSYLLASDSYSAYFQEHIRDFLSGSITRELNIEVIDIALRMREQENVQSHHWYHPNEGHLTPDGHNVVSHLVINNQH